MPRSLPDSARPLADAARERLRVPYVRKRARTMNLPPGALVFTGEEPAAPPRLTLFDYDADGLRERTPGSLDEALPLLDTSSVSWLNIDGVHDVDLMRQLGTHLGIDTLVLEDIVNTAQRPKFEEYDDYLFAVIKMLRYDAAAGALLSEQVSLLIGETYVVSFQEMPGDVLDPVRERIRHGRGRIRRTGPAYLGYALLDVIVDHYFIVLEQLGERTEQLEEAVLADPDTSTQQQINALRRTLILMRRAVWPTRELFAALDRSESPLLAPDLRPFLRDAYDHAVQVLDILESLRDVLSGLHDLYMSNLSNRMNEVMKVLTIIGTIFIPLTFIAGIYGMNFDHMPELHARYGYPIALGVMGALGLALVYFFRRRGWI